MPTECEIQFDQQNAVYSSGQQINGRVTLTTTKAKSIRAIHIQVNGSGKVKWDVRKSRRVNGKTEHYNVRYSSSDTYLASRTYVSGQHSGPSFELQPGTHQFTYAVVLPHGVPTSFVGRYGEIKYEVVVTIDRSMRFDNVFKKPFTVIRTMNLNMVPNLAIPIERETESSFCCCCCASGPIIMKLTLPFAGFASGQKIPYNLIVDNEAGSNVENVEVKFMQRIVFLSRSPERAQKTDEFTLHKDSLGSVLKYAKKEFNKEIQLGSLPPSNDDPGEIIQISYYVKAKMRKGFFHKDECVKIPVLIGTVPLIHSARNPDNIISMQPTAPLLSDDSMGGDKPPPYYTMGKYCFY
ncbi:hypothetical protein ACFFRR_000318 [Megaselia abdita]